MRGLYGLNPDHLVCGIVGNLAWNPRHEYCYGLELVESLCHVTREDVSVLIVGDGDGRAILEKRIPEHLRHRVVMTGRLPQDEIPRVLHAMDIGLIPQTLDGLGSYRLTTKLPEYLAAGLPVAMSPVPGFYDYVYPAGWALPARHPADSLFHREFARWLDLLDRTEVREKASQARAMAEKHFSYKEIADRFHVFIEELLHEGLPVRSRAGRVAQSEAVWQTTPDEALT